MQDIVSDKTRQLRDQIKNLEKMQNSTLNILEDLNDEKLLSEQRESDLQKFKMAVENAHDHIAITDVDGIVLYGNPAVSRITGFDLKEIMGTKAGVLWGKLMKTEFYKELWDTVKVKKGPFIGELLNHRKNGEKYQASCSISPILNKEGEVEFFVAIEKDITKAKEIDRMKTEFISLASHQLRTPLSAIKWYLEMLINGDAGTMNEEQTEYIHDINSSNERMIELVNALLNVSRIESGRIIIDPKPTNLGELINGILVELKPKILIKNINLALSVHSNLPLVNLDDKLVRQVFMNLLTNSIKYTPSGGEINIIISKTTKSLLTQVSDNGYGIPEKDKDRVFSKFYRGENIVSRETDGTGLGLYLVKAVVESSSGTIWFDSKENKGTTFWVDFPLEGSKPKQGEVYLDSPKS